MMKPTYPVSDFPSFMIYPIWLGLALLGYIFSNAFQPYEFYPTYLLIISVFAIIYEIRAWGKYQLLVQEHYYQMLAKELKKEADSK